MPFGLLTGWGLSLIYVTIKLISETPSGNKHYPIIVDMNSPDFKQNTQDQLEMITKNS